MTFKEFVDYHKGLTGRVISYEANSPGMTDLIRLWDTLALFRPDDCEDVVVGEITSDGARIFESRPNPRWKMAAEKTQPAQKRAVGKKRSGGVPLDERALGNETGEIDDT